MKLKKPTNIRFLVQLCFDLSRLSPVAEVSKVSTSFGIKGRSRHDLASSTSFRCWAIPAHFPQVFLSFTLHNQAEETATIHVLTSKFTRKPYCVPFKMIFHWLPHELYVVPPNWLVPFAATYASYPYELRSKFCWITLTIFLQTS